MKGSRAEQSFSLGNHDCICVEKIPGFHPNRADRGDRAGRHSGGDRGDFIVRPIEGYTALSRRAELVDSADTALRRMKRDIRLAVPNSVRVDGSGTMLELMETRDGGRYRAQIDPTDSTNNGDILDFTKADNSFQVLGSLDNGPQVGESVVVYNFANTGIFGNAYSGHNLADIATGSTADLIKLQPPKHYRFSSPYQRFFVIDGPVSYVCNSTNGTLTRYWNYTAAQDTNTTISAMGTGVSSALMTNHVSPSGCSFTYAPGTPSRGGLVTLKLTLSDSGEKITLLQQVHVEMRCEKVVAFQRSKRGGPGGGDLSAGGPRRPGRLHGDDERGGVAHPHPRPAGARAFRPPAAEPSGGSTKRKMGHSATRIKPSVGNFDVTVQCVKEPASNQYHEGGYSFNVYKISALSRIRHRFGGLCVAAGGSEGYRVMKKRRRLEFGGPLGGARRHGGPLWVGVLAGLFGVFALALGAQADTASFTAPGSHTWTVPAGVTSITIEAWGGGGAGGGVTGYAAGAGGGAGGQYAQKVIAVSAGANVSVVVGAGGNGDTGNGENGEDSSFDGSVVVAKGGAGGQRWPRSASGGSGGKGSSSGGVGDEVYAGGNGADGNVYYRYNWGGGGGGGRERRHGGDANQATAGIGTSTGGGNGGNGSPGEAGMVRMPSLPEAAVVAPIPGI